MAEHKQNAGEAIAAHIAGLESQLRSEKIVSSSFQEELNDRVVELAALGAQHRAKQKVNDQLVETVKTVRAELESQRTMFTETTLELQRQHNETRTSLERSERELEAERNRPLGSTDFVLHLMVTQAAAYLNQRFIVLCFGRAFPKKSFSRLQSIAVGTMPITSGCIEMPLGLQEIVKTYCATSRTAFDSDALLADISNYVDNNAAAILELSAVQDLFELRQSIRENPQTEKMVHSYNTNCPDAVHDFLVKTSSDYMFDREQHQHQLLESVKEIAVSFIEDISFEIPVTIE